MKHYHQCRAKNCVYDTKNINPEDEIRVNNNYYHRKCKEYLDLHHACVGAYSEKIDSTAPKNLLGKAFKDMIYVKKIDPKLILFTINYCSEKKERVRSVFSLYYYFKNKGLMDAYERFKLQQVDFDFTKAKITPEVNTKYRHPPKKGWNQIFEK